MAHHDFEIYMPDLQCAFPTMITVLKVESHAGIVVDVTSSDSTSSSLQHSVPQARELDELNDLQASFARTLFSVQA